MEKAKDDALLVDYEYRPRSFLQKKVRLTVPVCILLVFVFFSSTVIASIISYYWVGDTICYVKNREPIRPQPWLGPEPEPMPGPMPESVVLSRSKRSLPSEKKTLPCFGFECCETAIDPSAPWNRPRLPNKVYPVEYQLTLELHELNEPTDTYDGDLTIVLDILQSTSDIILHAIGMSYSEVSVLQHYGLNRTEIPVDCLIPFPATETLVIHMKEQLQNGSTYDVRIKFSRTLSIHGTGIFEVQYNADLYGLIQSRMIVTHFEAVHAREAYPCFDEPGFKAKFQLSVRHENNTKVISNWDQGENFADETSLTTEFQTTPPIPTALTAFAIFYTDDFSSKTVNTSYPATGRPIRITLWARRRYFENDGGIYIDAALYMIKDILDAYLNIFRDVDSVVVPTTLYFLAVPEYPSDAISHWGLMIFSELALLHNPMTISEADHQRIALLIAKELAEQWCGNLVSFQWWTDLWFQEALANFLKYHAVNKAYPSWNMLDRFSVEEHVPAMMDDSMSSSHPIVKSVNSAADINALFDSIETTKATAVLRMADYYMEKSTNLQNNTLTNIVATLKDRAYGFFIIDEFLSKYRIGTWNGADFFDRWLLQSNFPNVFARLIHNEADNTTVLQLVQSRFLSALQYDYDLYPPETVPFGYVWYVPISCSFGESYDDIALTRIFYLDKEQMNVSLGPLNFKYFYCNNDWAGYYIMDYVEDNWSELSEVLVNDQNPLSDLDRASLLHNVFLDAQSSEESYSVVAEVVQYIERFDYRGLLSWKTLSYHLNRMLDVLEYESLFSVVQQYFQLVIRKTYLGFDVNLWNENGTFSEQILKQVLVQMACRLELRDCIDKVTALWYEAYDSLVDGMANHTVVDHAREVVYRTHFRNTYNDSEWLTIENDYHYLVDIQEREHLLEALTQSRQPWHLYQLLYRDAEPNRDRDVDLLETLSLLAKNPVGRELVWLYYRENFDQLQTDYGRANQRLGQLLIDITATFEDQFHETELIDFLASIPGVENNLDARFWALERANMNFWWVVDNTDDITNAFDLEEKKKK